jgi:hypothetical protein
VQEAAREAVLAVFKSYGVEVVDDRRRAEVRGFKVVNCDDHPRVVQFQFASTSGEQTIGVWMCVDGVDECSNLGHGSVPARCADPVNRLVSSMESDLTDRVLARTKTRAATAVPTRWWADLSWESLLSLITVSRDRRPSLSDEGRLSRVAMEGSSRARPVVRRPNRR